MTVGELMAGDLDQEDRNQHETVRRYRSAIAARDNGVDRINEAARLLLAVCDSQRQAERIPEFRYTHVERPSCESQRGMVVDVLTSSSESPACSPSQPCTNGGQATATACAADSLTHHSTSPARTLAGDVACTHARASRRVSRAAPLKYDSVWGTRGCLVNAGEAVTSWRSAAPQCAGVMA